MMAIIAYKDQASKTLTKNIWKKLIDNEVYMGQNKGSHRIYLYFQKSGDPDPTETVDLEDFIVKYPNESFGSCDPESPVTVWGISMADSGLVAFLKYETA